MRLAIVCAITTVAAFVWGIFFFPYHHAPSYEILNFPLLEQPDDITCGPTSATMVLNYYGKKTTLSEVRLLTHTDWFKFWDEPVGTTSPEFIGIALSKHYIQSRLLRGNIERLKYFINKNRPPIILLRSGEYTWHYVVAIGFDEKHILIANPATGTKQWMPEGSFMGAWDFETNMYGQTMEDDILVGLLKAGEVRSRTMIVPGIHSKGDYMLFILGWLIFGFVVGLCAKACHPGEDPIGFFPTIGIGIAGSFIGGIIQWIFNMGGPLSTAGFLWSVLGGVIFCYGYRRFKMNQFFKAQGRMPKNLIHHK